MFPESVAMLFSSVICLPEIVEMYEVWLVTIPLVVLYWPDSVARFAALVDIPLLAVIIWPLSVAIYPVWLVTIPDVVLYEPERVTN